MAVQNYKELKGHIKHKIVCTYYGDKEEPENVAIECLTCNEVLVDYDKD